MLDSVRDGSTGLANINYSSGTRHTCHVSHMSYLSRVILSHVTLVTYHTCS